MDTSSYQSTLNFTDCVRGDTFGTHNVTIRLTGYNFAGTTAKAMVRTKVGKLVDELVVSVNTSVVGQIVCSIAQLPTITISYPLGTHYWDLELTLPNGEIKTYVKGEFVVLADRTYE